MRTLLLHLVASALVLSLGCGESSGSRSANHADAMPGDSSLTPDDNAGGRNPKVICDGSKVLRFAARVQGHNALPELMWQIGMSYIYVLGDCSFWSNRNVGAYAPTREGKLSEADAEQLSRDFGYGYWDSLQNSYTGADSSHTSLELYDARKRIVCSETACESYGSDRNRPIVSGFWPAYRDWLMRMEGLGQVVAGDVRALVFAFDDEESIADAQTRMFLITWTNAWPLADLIGDRYGTGIVTSGARADDLRALRAMYASQGGVMVPGSSVPLDYFSLEVPSEPRTFHQLWLRDAIPLEDVGGTIPLGDAGL